jgi:hypothetical protein
MLSDVISIVVEGLEIIVLPSALRSRRSRLRYLNQQGEEPCESIEFHGCEESFGISTGK